MKSIDSTINSNDMVSIKKMGDIIEICYTQHRNNSISIKKLNNNEYLVISTGEIVQCNHIKNRSENTFQVGQSLKRLRDYINTNVIEPLNCKWVTLTYRENMTDTKRLYVDFNNFMKRVRYHFKDFKIEYIVAMEPQGRGAWHCHLILIFDKNPGFINNSIIEKLWGNGFTSTHKLDNIDNIGAYLTAYLGDMEFNDTSFSTYIANTYGYTQGCYSEFKIPVKEINIVDGKKLDIPKRFIKGGRLYLYPPKFNIYRVSKGIKKPIKTYSNYSFAKRMLGIYAKTPNFTKTININDLNTKFKNTIIYEQYNKKRLLNDIS